MTIANLIKQAHSITVLTGAGVSTNSGIPDFKSTDEEWPYKQPRHELISLPYFYRNPTHFWEVYRQTFRSSAGAEPNGVHQWIADLEKDHEVTVVTQNIDGLHQKAGSSKVLEVHGSNLLAECLKCKNQVAIDSVADQDLPRCGNCRKPLKPAVILFSEDVRHFDEAESTLLASDLLIVMGTSLAVGPINMLPHYATHSDVKSVWVSDDDVPFGYFFDEVWIGDLKDFPIAQ